MAYKKIEGIKPFNDLQLKSCYYHQLAAAYTAYGIEPKVIAGNFLPLYEFDEEKKALKPDCREVLDENTLEVLTGVRRDKYKTVDGLEEFVIEKINAGKPILLLADCFYLEYRKDMYLQNHLSHYILVYGYDSGKREFIINEHQFRNSFRYVERTAAIDCIVQAYNGFLSRLMKNEYSLLVFTQVGEGRGNALESFMKGISSRATELKKSIEEFEKGMGYLRATLLSREEFEQNEDTVISFIGEVRGYKSIQKNILGYLFGKGELYGIADRIMEDYIFLHGLLVKMKVMRKYDRQHIGKILIRCDELTELERKMHLKLRRGEYA